MFLPTGSAAGSSAGIVFSQGRHVALIKVKFGTEDVGPLLHAKFHLDRSRVRGLRPPKLKKIGILPI